MVSPASISATMAASCFSRSCGVSASRGSKRASNSAEIAAASAGMLDEGRPHVVLGIGHADLAQIARQRAQQRHLAPVSPATSTSAL